MKGCDKRYNSVLVSSHDPAQTTPNIIENNGFGLGVRLHNASGTLYQSWIWIFALLPAPSPVLCLWRLGMLMEQNLWQSQLYDWDGPGMLFP